MKWSKIFSKECMHQNVPIDVDLCYCPDCGELIENQWYLVRCASCGLKEMGTIKDGEIIPLTKYCHNCGGQDYYIEKLDKIDCININYAVLKRVVIKNEIQSYTQSWVDTIQTSFDIPKLLK